MPSPFSNILIFPMGGAVNRIDPLATAFAQRQVAFGLDTNASWVDAVDDLKNIEWSRGLISALQPFSTGGVYVNLDGDLGEEIAHKAYPGETYARLAALKQKYDPANFFKMNQNIKPGA